MTTAAARKPFQIQCHYRPMILFMTAIVLLGVFWFATRYPQLFRKAEHLGQALPSMAFSSQLIVLAEDAPTWQKILASAVNWLDSMKIGMTFGVLFGRCSTPSCATTR